MVQDQNQKVLPLAVLLPSGYTLSVRQDLLSQDCVDVLAWAFANRPYCGFEVKISDAEHEVRAVLFGGDSFCAHYGSDSQKYFTHYNDLEWAVIMNCDCSGDALRGDKIVQKYMDGENYHV